MGQGGAAFKGVTTEDTGSEVHDTVGEFDRDKGAAVLEDIVQRGDTIGDIALTQAGATPVFASCFISTTCVLNGRKVMTQIL